jgi:hypothetical protein
MPLKMERPLSATGAAPTSALSLASGPHVGYDTEVLGLSQLAGFLGHEAIRTHTTLNFYPKKNILSWSTKFFTLYHNPPHSYLP